jgi:hypothetical protein
MVSNEHPVEMSFPPFASLLSPPELLRFTERMALPTLQTRIIPLGTFSKRTEAKRVMMGRLKALAQDPQQQAAGRTLP